MAEAGSDGSHPLAVEVKPARLELLKVKSAAEQEPEKLVLDCRVCGQRVHCVSGSASPPAIGLTANRRRATSRPSDRRPAPVSRGQGPRTLGSQ